MQTPPAAKFMERMLLVKVVMPVAELLVKVLLAKLLFRLRLRPCRLCPVKLHMVLILVVILALRFVLRPLRRLTQGRSTRPLSARGLPGDWGHTEW